MCVNKLTDRNNMLWESSRMILPEHKERIRSRRDEARRGGKRGRPELDEQRLEELQAAINEAIATRQPVSVAHNLPTKV